MLSGSSALPCLLFLLLRHDTLIKIMWLKKLSPLCSFFPLLLLCNHDYNTVYQKKKDPNPNFYYSQVCVFFFYTHFFLHTPKHPSLFWPAEKSFHIHQVGFGEPKITTVWILLWMLCVLLAWTLNEEDADVMIVLYYYWTRVISTHTKQRNTNES